MAGATDTLANLANTINNNQIIASGTAGHLTATLNSTGTSLVVTTQVAGVTATSGYTDVVSAATVLDTAASDALTGTPSAAGSASSSTIGTLTGLTATSAYTAGSLNIGSNAAITLGVSAGTSKTDTLADIEATVNAGKYGVTASLNTAGTVLSFAFLQLRSYLQRHKCHRNYGHRLDSFIDERRQPKPDRHGDTYRNGCGSGRRPYQCNYGHCRR